MEIWHLTLASASRLTLFPTEELRRAAAVRIVRIAGGRVLMFAIVDDHGHVLVVCSVHDLPTLRSALSRALAKIAAAPLGPSHVTPVRSRAHLLRCVPYFLTQPEHHGIERPVLDAGCCFQDLVSARILPGFQASALKRVLPRLTRRDLLDIAKLPETALVPATPSEIRRTDVPAIVRVSAATVGAPGDLRARDASSVLASRVAAHLCGIAGTSRRELGSHFPRSARAIRRLAREEVPEPILRAARVHVSLEAACRLALRTAS